MLQDQGASVVRFANSMLDAYKKEKNFIFVAIYISGIGIVERYILFQNEKRDPHKVRAHVLYILNPMLNHRRFIGRNERSNWKTYTTALDLRSNCTTFLRRCTLIRTSGTQRISSRNSRQLSTEFWTRTTCQHSRPVTRALTAITGTVRPIWINPRRKNNNGGADDQLEESGYKVVPDVLETDVDPWELTDKVEHTRFISPLMTPH
jgi:hypothetical protein